MAGLEWVMPVVAPGVAKRLSIMACGLRVAQRLIDRLDGVRNALILLAGDAMEGERLW